MDCREEAASVFAMPDGGDAPVGTRPFRPRGFVPDGSLALSCGALSARSIDRYPEEPPKTVYTDGKGCGDFPGGSVRVLMQSLRTLLALEGDMKVHPGHEADTTLAEERAFFRF